MKAMINPSKYAVLLAIEEAGSLTLAADRLGYTQSGVSHIIADLEAECGFPLVVRSKAGSVLTRDGEKLIEPIRSMIRAQEKLSEAIDEVNGLRSGKVKVGMFSSAAVHWAPEIAERFAALCPNIELELFSGLYHEIENKVLSEELDCGFLTKKTKKDLNFSELTRDRLLVVLPKGHPLAKLDAVPIELIGREDFIIPGEGTGYDIGDMFSSRKVSPRIKYSLSDDRAALSMVQRGLGITILPELILEGLAGEVELKELDPPFFRTIGIVSRPNRLISPAAKAFMDFVLEFAKGIRMEFPMGIPQ